MISKTANVAYHLLGLQQPLVFETGGGVRNSDREPEVGDTIIAEIPNGPHTGLYVDEGRITEVTDDGVKAAFPQECDQGGRPIYDEACGSIVVGEFPRYMLDWRSTDVRDVWLFRYANRAREEPSQ
jgi:hypothetical protein